MATNARCRQAIHLRSLASDAASSTAKEKILSFLIDLAASRVSHELPSQSSDQPGLFGRRVKFSVCTSLGSWSEDKLGQRSTVKPNLAASLAGIDHDASGLATAVGMMIHGAFAHRTMQTAVGVGARVRSQEGCGPPVAMVAQIVD